jgi:hypothetical protein
LVQEKPCLAPLARRQFLKDEGCSSTSEILPQTYDSNALEFAKFKQCLVTGYDDFGMTCHSAFQYPVVRLVLHDAKPQPGPYQGPEVRNEHRNSRKLLSVARELAREDAKQFVENGLGEYEIVALLKYSLQRSFASPAWKDQGRHQDVGVEDDLHALK